MRLDIVLRWLNQSERRNKVMLALRQPSTAKQLAHRVQFSLDGCSYIFWELTRYRLLRCLNPLANRSRLYWLTILGRDSQRLLFKKAGRDDYFGLQSDRRHTLGGVRRAGDCFGLHAQW